MLLIIIALKLMLNDVADNDSVEKIADNEDGVHVSANDDVDVECC